MSQPRVSVGPGCEKENVMAHEIGHVVRIRLFGIKGGLWNPS